MTPINVLISLHKGYGLGDAVAMSAVLRHVEKHRPNWRVDFQAEEGRHVVGRGIVANTFAYGQQPPDKHYDAEVQILLFDSFAAWTDRPNTRVSSCLHERFGLAWDEECAGYYVEVSDGALKQAKRIISGIRHDGKIVAVHYRGTTAKHLKDLTHAQAAVVCNVIHSMGRSPLIMAGNYSWGDAEMNTAVISQCEAFVGIDSGPGKCASATGTPSLIVWTGHHPAVFHDPAPNTEHLVPAGYHSFAPVRDHIAVVEWFEKHYRTREYSGDPVPGIKTWLEEKLR